MSIPEKRIRWSIERRLSFIEFRLFWDGRINRGDIKDFFGISTPQASADLRRYQELAAGNIAYDKAEKTYVATPAFRPRFFRPSADRYLAQLQAIGGGVLSEEETWLARLPPYAVVAPVQRRVATQLLRAILESIRIRAAVHIKYQSFSFPTPRLRWITPHSLAFDGFRWHVRAYCNENKDFRDFVLARCLQISGMRPQDCDFERDTGWHRTVTLKIAPHPELGEAMRRAIEIDYGMEQGVAELTTRVCLSYYLERLLGLDLAQDCASPQRQQVVLLNRSELEADRLDAQKATGLEDGEA